MGCMLRRDDDQLTSKTTASIHFVDREASTCYGGYLEVIFISILLSTSRKASGPVGTAEKETRGSLNVIRFASWRCCLHNNVLR